MRGVEKPGSGPLPEVGRCLRKQRLVRRETIDTPFQRDEVLYRRHLVPYGVYQIEILGVHAHDPAAAVIDHVDPIRST